MTQSLVQFSDSEIIDRLHLSSDETSGRVIAFTGRDFRRLISSKEERAETSTQTFSLFLGILFVLAFLGLLAINTLATQDAFRLQKLKSQALSLNDQRESLIRRVAAQSTPQRLSAAAVNLGMIPTEQPRFIDLHSEPSNSSSGDLSPTRVP